MADAYNTGAGSSGPRASVGLRIVAVIIDGVIVGIVAGILSAVLGNQAGYGLGTVLSIAYHTYFEGQPAGQTIGKKAMNIRVIDFANGGSIDTSKALVRSLVRQVSGLVCLLGYFWSLFNKESQTWHDLAANTVVVPTSAYPVP